MKSHPDLASLPQAELVSLVHQLQAQLAEREQEIERLTRLLAAGKPIATTDEISSVPQEPAPGSMEDLRAQLEKIYPGGR